MNVSPSSEGKSQEVVVASISDYIQVENMRQTRKDGQGQSNEQRWRRNVL